MKILLIAITFSNCNNREIIARLYDYRRRAHDRPLSRCHIERVNFNLCQFALADRSISFAGCSITNRLKDGIRYSRGEEKKKMYARLYSDG